MADQVGELNKRTKLLVYDITLRQYHFSWIMTKQQAMPQKHGILALQGTLIRKSAVKSKKQGLLGMPMTF